MKVLVFGGSEFFDDREAVFKALDRLDRKRTIYLVIEGGEKDGVDAHARDWAKSRGACWLEFPVTVREREALGELVVGERDKNILMMAGPDGAVMFPGGEEAEALKAACLKAGVKVWEPLAPPTPQRAA